jgi:dinuclear metal center YbgI/SA1388 family protein
MPAPHRRPAPSCQEVAGFLNRLLRVGAFSDAALNGLQIEGSRPVRRVVAGVDASLALFAAAQAKRADLLLVHHGLFWGKPFGLTGIHARRLRLALTAGFGLYAAHLPLDAHPVCGNNALLARGLGLSRLRPFGEYHGEVIGMAGVFSRPLTRSRLAQKMAELTGAEPKVLALGPEQIRSVGLVSGNGGDLAVSALESGERLDAFITGEASHSVFHPCAEGNLNLFLGGHYATETLGVKALLHIVEKKYGIRGVFLDLPTGM